MYVLLCRHACMDHESMGRLLAYLFFILIAYLLAELDDTRDHHRIRHDCDAMSPSPAPLPPPAVYMWGLWAMVPIGFLFFLKKLYLCGLKYICMQYIVFFL
jgi:hypothetical protein